MSSRTSPEYPCNTNHQRNLNALLPRFRREHLHTPVRAHATHYSNMAHSAVADTFVKPIVHVTVRHPRGCNQHHHLVLCVPDSTSFEDLLELALGHSDGALPADLIAAIGNNRRIQSGGCKAIGNGGCKGASSIATYGAPAVPPARVSRSSQGAEWLGWIGNNSSRHMAQATRA